MKTISILLVEDDEIFASLLKNLLESQGYHNLSHCSNGISTLLEIFEEGNIPDVVLMDYELGRLNGLEVMQRIIAFKPDLKIIFISTHLNMDVIISSMKSGAVDFISKDEDILKNLLPLLEKIKIEKNFVIEHGRMKELIRSINKILLLSP